MNDPFDMLFHEAWLAGSGPLNDDLYHRFLALYGSERTRQTDYFDGRFENIYVDRADIPRIEVLLDFFRKEAGNLLGMSPQRLRAGFWFNATEPGFRTAPHHHDENDELLSAAYYIRVPANSGSLLLRDVEGTITVQPEEGKLVLFPPDVVHEVEVNNGDSMRLSVGMNIGPAEE